MAYCLRCEIEFKRSEKSVVKCIICEEKYHGKCVKLTDEEIALLINNDFINFTCKTCSKMGVLTEIKELKNIIQDLIKVVNEQKESIDNNSELINKIGNKLEINSGNTQTYSETLNKNREILLIKPKNDQNNEITRKDLKVNIDPSKLAIGVENVKNIKNGGVIINCSDANSKGIMKNKVVEVMGDKYKVEEGQLKKPKIMIVGAEEDFLEMENEEVLKAIIEQNNKNWDGKVSVVKKYSKRNKKNSTNIVIEVEPDIHVNILKTGKINIGWKKCVTYEYFDITRCFNCAGYNHKANKCTNNTACFKCGENHKTDKCRSDIIKCINCTVITQKYKVNLNADHYAYDLNCPCYKKCIERESNKIKYNF